MFLVNILPEPSLFTGVSSRVNSVRVVFYQRISPVEKEFWYFGVFFVKIWGVFSSEDGIFWWKFTRDWHPICFPLSRIFSLSLSHNFYSLSPQFSRFFTFFPISLFLPSIFGFFSPSISSISLNSPLSNYSLLFFLSMSSIPMRLSFTMHLIPLFFSINFVCILYFVLHSRIVYDGCVIILLCVCKLCILL